MFFDSEYRRLAALVESEMLVANERESTLYRASNYSLQAGGKRFRPVLALAVAKLIEESEAHFLPFACALEFLHTASLIHDDLPALDNDALRRGRPSCHRVYGEGTALLAGDSLIARAFLVLAQTSQLSVSEKIILTQELAWAFNELCDGQVLDIEAEAGFKDFEDASHPQLTSLLSLDFSADFALELTGLESADDRSTLLLLEHRHRQKTGALIRAAAVGPLAARDWPKLKPQAYQAVERYSDLLGLLFQLTDDLLDVEGTTAVMGKPVGSDERRQLPTFASLLGVERTRRFSQAIHQQALLALQPFGKQAWFLSELASRILNRTH